MNVDGTPTDNAFDPLEAPRPSLGGGIYVNELLQYCTYLALLEGCPTASMNQRLIDQALAHADRSRKQALLIDPERRPLPSRSLGRNQTADDHLEILPLITCVAHVMKHGGDGQYDLSVVWFQDTLAPPFHPKVEATLRDLDWSRHAAFCAFEDL